jgi:hypothetical protein
MQSEWDAPTYIDPRRRRRVRGPSWPRFLVVAMVFYLTNQICCVVTTGARVVTVLSRRAAQAQYGAPARASAAR